MLRFVIAPDGEVVCDIEARLPGRGFWLSADRDMIHKAIVGNLFSKAARAKVRVPADLADRAEGLLARKCLDTIGMARRAGQAVAGFAKVEAWLNEGRGAGVLLAAADGAPQGREKMQGHAPSAPLVDLFSADELGAAFGRDHTVHAVIGPGRLATSMVTNAVRLKGLKQATAVATAIN